MPCGGGRLKVSDINDHVKCTLCEGYLVDATAIIECLHAFCRTCIVHYLENSNYCPVCDVQVHKTKPLLSIRSDQTLQDVVYKLVPGLYQNEMQRRREFYAENPEAESATLDLEERGEGEPRFFSPKEPVSLCLQLRTRELVKPAELSDFKDPITTRHLKCPAAFTVGHLKKFVHLKFSLPNTFTVEIFYDDHLLRDGFTLMDIAYIYSWKRAEPMRFFYTVTKRIPRCTEPPPQISTTTSLGAEESADNSEPPRVSIEPEEPMEIDPPTPLAPDLRPVADPETPSLADQPIPDTNETVVTSSVEEAQLMDTTEQPPERVVGTATHQEGQQCNSDVTPCNQSSIQNRTSSSPPVGVPAKPPPQVPTTPYKVVSLSSPSGGALSSSSPTHNGFRLKFIHDKKKTAKSSSRKSSSGSGSKRQKEGTHKHHHKPVRLARLAPYPPPPPVTCLTTTGQAQVVPGQLKVTVGKLVPSVIKTFVTTLVSTTTSSSNSTTTTVGHSSVMDVVSGSPCPPAAWLAPPFLNCGSQSVGNSIASASSTTATSSSSVSSPHTISSLPQTKYTTKELPSITTSALPVVALAAISSNSSMPLPNAFRNSAHIAMAPSEVSSSRTISIDTLSSDSRLVADNNGTVVPSSGVSEQKRNSDGFSHVSEFCSSVTGVVTTCPPPVISNNHPVPSASNCTVQQCTDMDSHIHDKQLLVNKNSGGSHVGGLTLPSSIAAAKNSNDVDGHECPDRSISPKMINGDENSSKDMKSSTTSWKEVDSSHCISSSPVNGILSDKSSTMDSPAVTHSDLSSVTDMNNKSASGVDLLNINSSSVREDSNGLSYDKIPSMMEGAHSNSSSKTKDVVRATSPSGVVVHSQLGVINSNDRQQQQQTTLLSADYSDDDLGCQSDLVVDEQKMEDRSSDEDEESEDLRKKISAIANNDDEDTEADSGRASDMSCPARSPPVSSGVTESSVVTTTTISMTTTADRPMKVGSSIDHVIKQLYLQHEIGRVMSPRPTTTTTTTTSKGNASSGALDLSTGCDRARKPASSGRPRPVANPVLDLKHRQQSYMPAPIKQHTACPPAPAKQHSALPPTNASPLLMQHLTGSGSILQAQLTGGKHPLHPHHHHPSLHPLHAAAAALPYSLPMGRNSSLVVSSSSSLSSSSPLVPPTYSYKFSPAHQGTYAPVGSAMLPYGSSLLNRMPPGFAGMLQPARMLSANSSSPIGSGSKSPLPGCHATTTTKQQGSSRRLSEALVAASSSSTPASHPRASPSSSLMRLSPLHRSASPAPSPQSMSVSSSSSNNNSSSSALLSSSSSSQCGGSNHHHKSSSSVHHHHRSSSKGPTNHRFRKGPNLAVFNPDPNGFRQKLVIKNLDSAPRPSIKSSNSHHHHHS